VCGLFSRYEMANFDVIETGIEGKVQVIPSRDLNSEETVPFTLPKATVSRFKHIRLFYLCLNMLYFVNAVQCCQS